MTRSPVTKNALRFEDPFRRWIKENARILATVWPDVLKYGLFIVASTYTTTEARTNIMQANSHKVTVGFNAGFTPVGEIAPSTTWHTSSADSGWITTIADKVGLESKILNTRSHRPSRMTRR